MSGRLNPDVTVMDEEESPQQAGTPAAGVTGTAAAADSAAPGGQHYEEVAANYESAFFYSSLEYREWVMEHLMRHFGLPDEVGRMDRGRGDGWPGATSMLLLLW